ncbi:hypothetical protein [Rhizobium metallidurans]|uniref:Antifreeze protein n=1 Tax=Rhizobium metallidurans TaxID=1265931 RepID=A0A7W6GBF5_9HYPH|nr:hypothetical protein [Rhizobium metallidurans]MBB3963566.1 hypothetical protein [Rhizobium metallidurans]
MMQFLTKAGIALVLGAGTLAGATVPASAQVDIYIDGGRPPPHPGYGRPPPPPGYGRPPPPPFYGRPPPPPPGYYGRPRGCDPRLAEAKASDYGFRRARVVDMTPRRVIVQGFTRRGPDEITFGNVRGCPVLR